jgi:CRISPR-associated endonuclease/helicase Cas3
VTFRDSFGEAFGALTGHEPFPWQEALFDEFLRGSIPASCDIPTGLGKTSVIAIWLLALAERARSRTLSGFPRRLAYVVNRRTVVDQATREAVDMRRALAKAPALAGVADALSSLVVQGSGPPLAISTLRGEFADNAEWRDDPSRPSVVVGTVDMIGSRLLFSGYRCGFKSRPLHAGFLGQDVLLLHDEAHLEPAFQQLVGAIEAEQKRCREFRRFSVMALTATSRAEGLQFGLGSKDRKHPMVTKRLEARKSIALHPVDDEKDTAERIAELALRHADTGEAILIFLRKLEDVRRVKTELQKHKQVVELLTGTLRGRERDRLALDNPVFARFAPEGEGVLLPTPGTVFLVATSAGEVGVNISADHLVCDLSPFESMVQRFGRVNRFGNGNASIDLVHPNFEPDEELSAYDLARARTVVLLRALPRTGSKGYDGCPAALAALPIADRLDAFTPSPAVPPTSDILFDAWTLTTIRTPLPARPAVSDWLHGIAEWEPPETSLAWRQEVRLLRGELLEHYHPGDLLEDYPLKAHELLRDRSDRVFAEVERITARHPGEPVWLVDDDGSIVPMTLAQVVAEGARILEGRTVLLPPAVGGLDKGFLTGDSPFNQGESYDVADEWNDEGGKKRRLRVWDDEASPEGMRLVRAIDLGPDSDGAEGEGTEPPEDEEQPASRRWLWYVRPRSADDDGSRSARNPHDLEPHLASAADFARALASKLGIPNEEANAVEGAARWHDLGKDRALWQRSIRNQEYPKRVLAKSGTATRPIDINGYRHELGSLLDLSGHDDFCALSPEMRDLVLHLVATHHGRARPHFPEEELVDPGHADDLVVAAAREVPRRFARLQRKYGRWGLAFLESILRAADALASQSAADGAAAAVQSAGDTT